MGRVKLGHPKRETKAQRIEKRLAVAVLVHGALVEKREAFIEVFGEMMTQAEREQYLATGVFDGTSDDGVIPEPITK